jgi:hypothetical protein
MVSRKIVESARFLKMPATSQNLYFHLLVNADDDGVVEAYRVLSMCKANEDDLRVLVGKEFVTVLNEDMVTYIEDWLEQNKIRADRKTDSIYKNLLLQMKPGIELVEKKARSDVKKTKKKDGLSLDGPRTAQGNIREDKSSKDNSVSLSFDRAENDRTNEEAYREIISKNIGLTSLLESAKISDGEYRTTEKDMVLEIYEIICDAVCHPRVSVYIDKIAYSGDIVKSRFLKLKHVHIANILNKILGRQEHIENMHGYLVSTLFRESMSGVIAEQAELHDDYLNSLRGQPYAI